MEAPKVMPLAGGQNGSKTTPNSMLGCGNSGVNRGFAYTMSGIFGRKAGSKSHCLVGNPPFPGPFGRSRPTFGQGRFSTFFASSQLGTKLPQKEGIGRPVFRVAQAAHMARFEQNHFLPMGGAGAFSPGLRRV